MISDIETAHDPDFARSNRVNLEKGVSVRSMEFHASRMIRPAVMLAMILTGMLFLVSCGAEAPTIEPGNIVITSEPAGAAIFLDDEDTGFITPHTFAGLEPAIYLVWVELDEFVSNKDTVSIFLGPLDTHTEHFQLSQTGFSINSPAGARILVDQQDTGKMVPASVAGLEPPTVILSLELDGFLVTPAQYEVTIEENKITGIPDDVFTERTLRNPPRQWFQGK